MFAEHHSARVNDMMDPADTAVGQISSLVETLLKLEGEKISLLLSKGKYDLSSLEERIKDLEQEVSSLQKLELTEFAYSPQEFEQFVEQVDGEEGDDSPAKKKEIEEKEEEEEVEETVVHLEQAEHVPMTLPLECGSPPRPSSPNLSLKQPLDESYGLDGAIPSSPGGTVRSGGRIRISTGKPLYTVPNALQYELTSTSDKFDSIVLATSSLSPDTSDERKSNPNRKERLSNINKLVSASISGSSESFGVLQSAIADTRPDTRSDNIDTAQCLSPLSSSFKGEENSSTDQEETKCTIDTEFKDEVMVVENTASTYGKAALNDADIADDILEFSIVEADWSSLSGTEGAVGGGVRSCQKWRYPEDISRDLDGEQYIRDQVCRMSYVIIYSSCDAPCTVYTLPYVCVQCVQCVQCV